MKRRIAEIMTRVVEYVTPEMCAQEVAARMKDRDLGCFPVCDGGVVVGIITDRDLVLRVLAEGRDASTTRIEAVMTREVVCCDPENRVADAVVAMTERKVRRIPVVASDGRLVGVVTLGKLAETDHEAAGTILREMVHSPSHHRS